MPSKNTFIPHPTNNTLYYGIVPPISQPRFVIEGGEIRLRHGKHIGLNRGFGVQHIWQQHKHELQQSGFPARTDVPQFVASVINPGSRLYCEFASMKGHPRLSVVRNANGLAVLEAHYLGDGTLFYSVVTAFPKGKAHGTLIGNVG